MAAGEEMETPDTSPQILVDMSAVWPLSEPKIGGQVMADRLAGHDPSRYRGWKAEQVTKAVKMFGMSARSVWVPELGKSAQGYDREELIEAFNVYVVGLDEEPVDDPSDDFVMVGVAD
jgi:hypothetical protein